MKQYFLYAMAVLIPAGLAGWFFWMLGKSFWTMYQDWKLGHELDQIQADQAKRRESSSEPPPAPDEATGSTDYTSRM